jgi:hypothetical protein
MQSWLLFYHAVILNILKDIYGMNIKENHDDIVRIKQDCNLL